VDLDDAPDEGEDPPLVADVVVVDVVAKEDVVPAIAGSPTAPDDPLVSAVPAMPEAVAAVCAAPGPASATSSGRTIRAIRNSWAMAASDPNLTPFMRLGARRSSPQSSRLRIPGLYIRPVARYSAIMDDQLEQPFPRRLSGRLIANPPNGLIPARTPLLGRHIDLEPLNPAIHASELYKAGHGSDETLRIWDYLPWGPWVDQAAFTASLRSWAATFDYVWFSLRPKNTGTADGMATYLDIHPLDGVIEIGGIWFSPELQRTRAATEALFMLLRYAMDDLGYRRMQWRCNSLNVKSRNAARRLGFRFEGVFYNHLIFKGTNRDTAWYSILDDEWPEVREIIKVWLDDSNFDPAGVARRSLSALMEQRSPSRRAPA
jgi:RimJ/RimL family protein N-acetyltransferase